MIEIPIHRVTADDINRLVSERATESRYLEFKRKLPDLKEPKQVEEMMGDISAIANAGGGYIVFGIAEEADGTDGTKCAAALCNAFDGDSDSREVQVTQLVKSRLEPNGFEVLTKTIECQPGIRVLVVLVPESNRKPIRVKSNGKWFVRFNNSKFELEYHQIRDMFLNSELGPEKIRQFRMNRLERFADPNELFSVWKSRKIVLHIVPAAFHGKTHPKIDQYTKKPKSVPKLVTNLSMARTTLEGVIHAFFDRNNSRDCLGYTYVFRDGSVEFVDAITLDTGDDLVFEDTLLPAIRRRIETGMDILSQVGLSGQAFILLTLLGIGHVQLSRATNRPSHKTNPHSNILLFPEQVAVIGSDLTDCINSLNQLVFQAFGYNSAEE